MLWIFFVECLNAICVIECLLQLFLLLQVLAELLHDLSPLLLSQHDLWRTPLPLHLRLLWGIFGRGLAILVISFVFYLLLFLDLRLITINCRIRHRLLLHLIWLKLRASGMIGILAFALVISTSWLLRSSSCLVSVCIVVYSVR